MQLQQVTEYSSVVCKHCRLCEDASTYQTSTYGVGTACKVAEGLCSRLSSAVGERCCLFSDARMYQTITSSVMDGSAGKVAQGGLKELCSQPRCKSGAQAVRNGGL